MNLGSIDGVIGKVEGVVGQIDSIGLVEKSSVFFDKVASSLGNATSSLQQYVPEQFSQYKSAVGILLTLALILISVLAALYSARIFKIAITVLGSYACGAAASMLADYVCASTSLGESLPETTPIIAGVIGAAIGVAISYALFSLIVFALGAAGTGYAVYTYLTMSGAVAEPTKQIIVAALAALVGGFLVVFFFKFLYILATSMGGMIAAGTIIGVSIAPGYNAVILAIIACSIIAGLFAMRFQYRRCNL